MTSTIDTVSAFVEAMRATGVEPDEPISNKLAAGEFIRFRCKDERKANGWARLFLDGRPAGRYGNHRLGIDATWKADAAPVQRSTEERSNFKAKIAREKAERQRLLDEQHETVAEQAAALIASAKPADPDHRYLIKKRVVGESLYQRRDILLVPMRDASGRIWNVQRIYPDGIKLFLKGGRIDGLFWLVAGAASTALPLCLGEGVGTMSAIRRATGYDVAAAFSAANLGVVARALRELWPDRPITICADDDAHLVQHPRIRRNLGVDAAIAAAASIGARLAIPPRSSAHG